MMVDETRSMDPPQEPQQVDDVNVPSDSEELPVGDGVEVASDLNASAEAESAVNDSQEDSMSNISATAVTSDQAAKMSEMESKLTELKSQLEDRTSQYMRIAADFENHRRRTSKEREDQQLQVKCNTISELLPVIDNFERARSQIKPQTEQEMTIHKSYQSVYKQLVDCLKRLGVSAMRAEGQEFDPNLHEAVMREPTDQYPEGTVMEELVRGYMIGDQNGDRVMRHAMVKVSAPPEPMQEATSDESEEVG